MLLKAIDSEDQILFTNTWNHLWTREIPSEVFSVLQGSSANQKIFISEDLFKPEFIPAEVAYSILTGSNRFKSSDVYYFRCPFFDRAFSDGTGKPSYIYESNLKDLSLALDGRLPLSKALPVLNCVALFKLLPRPFKRVMHKYKITLLEFLLRFPEYIQSNLGEPLRLLLQIGEWKSNAECEFAEKNDSDSSITILISDLRFKESQDLQAETFMAYLYARTLASERVFLVDQSLNILHLLHGQHKKQGPSEKRFTLRDLAFQDLCYKINTKYILALPNASPKAGAIDRAKVFEFREDDHKDLSRVQKNLVEIDSGIVGLTRKYILNIEVPWRQVVSKLDILLKHPCYSAEIMDMKKKDEEIWLVCVGNKEVDFQRCWETLKYFIIHKVNPDTVIAILQLSTMKICYLEEPLRREDFLHELRRWGEQKSLIQLFGEGDRADFKTITGICKNRSLLDTPFWVSFTESITTSSASEVAGIVQARSQLTPYRAVTRGYVGGLQCYDARLLLNLEYKDSYNCLHNLNSSIALQLLGSGLRPYVVQYPLLMRNISLHPTVLESGPIGIRKASLLNESALFENQEIYEKYSTPLLSAWGSLTRSPNFYLNEVIISNPKICVSIIIPFKDKASMTEDCVQSVVAHAENIPFEIILVNNKSIEAKTHTWMARITSHSRVPIRIIDFDKEFNYASINNEAARHATGDYLLLMNNDIKIIQNNFLQLLLNPFGLKSVGCVGATLLYPDGCIQHHGVSIPWGIQSHDTLSPGKNQNIEILQLNHTCFESGDVYSAVTAACMLVPAKLYTELEGMNEEFVVAYNDIDFCLRLGKIGFECINVSTPIGIHYESKSRGLDLKGENYNRLYREGGLLRAQHKYKYDHGDIYYSSILDQASSVPRLARPLATAVGESSPSLKLSLHNHDISGLTEILVYASYSHNGQIPDFVTRQIEIFAQHVPVIFVMAVESLEVGQRRLEQLSKCCHILIVRENNGYDFGSWASAVRLYGKYLQAAKRVYFVNDSCYGPFGDISDMFSRIRNCPADLVALTDNTVFHHHLQSFFVAWNSRMIRSRLFYHFWNSVCQWREKSDIIKAYEVGLGTIVREVGATVKAVYTDMPHENATHTQWRELLERGFPFVKRELIAFNPTGQDISGIFDKLKILDPLSSSTMKAHLRL